MEKRGTLAPVQIMKELKLLSWTSTLIGLDHGWMNKQDVINYAVDQLVAHINDVRYDPAHHVALLAGGEHLTQEDMRALLMEIIKDSDSSVNGEASQELKQWRLAHLVALTRSGLSSEQILDRLEEIYAEFVFPEDMRQCSRYNLYPEERSASLGLGNQTRSPLSAMVDVIDHLTQELVHRPS